jgi:hypothetical protein
VPGGRVGVELRRLVAARANQLCEYCLLHEDDTYFGCEVDHVVSRKHGGLTEEDNLAYACALCNRNKGSDLGSLEPDTGELVRFYDPRRDRWTDHFRLAEDGVTIVPLTPVGRVTVRILGLNHNDRLLERTELREIGRYPPEAGMRLFST